MKSRLFAFTLIETILYLALFNMIIFAVVTFTISISQSNKTAEYRNALEKNVIFINEHLSDAFRHSNTIDEANSTFEQSAGKVRVVNGVGYKEYFISNSTLQMTNGTSTYSLNDSMVDVTSFIVQKVLDADGNIKGVRIQATVRAEKFTSETKTIDTYYAFR